MCATGGGKKRRATHDYSHSTFLRGTRCHNYPRWTFTSRSPAAGRFVLLFCITPALFCDEKKMACFDLIWHCCGRDCRGSEIGRASCRERVEIAGVSVGVEGKWEVCRWS